jgi:hypothetical protein
MTTILLILILCAVAPGLVILLAMGGGVLLIGAVIVGGVVYVLGFETVQTTLGMLMIGGFLLVVLWPLPKIIGKWLLSVTRRLSRLPKAG